MITVEARVTGRRRPLVPAWQIPLDPDYAKGGEALTLRRLIARIVREEVQSFRDRQNDRRLLHVLSEREIDAGADRGRIDSGGRTLYQRVAEEEAVGVALDGFEDGLYLVLIDGLQHKELDEQVFPGPDSTVTFLRLVPLAGG
jgi:hypothetical protein